jgi:hypothetical protein
MVHHVLQIGLAAAAHQVDGIHFGLYRLHERLAIGDGLDLLLDARVCCWTSPSRCSKPAIFFSENASCEREVSGCLCPALLIRLEEFAY